jgi:hypothetical protein
LPEAKLPKPDNEEFKKKSEQALELINQYCGDLFADQYQKPYAVINVNAHAETMPIGSSNFKHWMARLFHEKKKETLSSEDINSALNALKGRALYDGPRRYIELRVASIPGDDNTIYYDLTNEKWQCVKITKDGWTVEQAPVLFARYNNHLPQVEPARDAQRDSFDKFLALTNISNEDHKLLLKCYIVALFIPNFAKAVLLAHGDQGGGKTFSEVLIKLLVDPSVAETLTFPKSPTELIQQLSHNYIALYDNISKMDDWISDALCKAVSGGGASKRMLYSDDDDIIYNFKRCIMLNGINVAARKADLLDRSIIIQFERIPPEKRRKESELKAELQAIKPQLLGYIMDVLVEVLRRKGEVKLAEYPRMADFAEYGELIARCMGYQAGEFTKAYFANIKLQTVEVLEASPIGTAIIKLMENRAVWGPGAPRELLEVLQGIAAELKIDTKARLWPKAPNSLSRRLNEVKTNLREIGLEVKKDTDPQTNTNIIEVRKISPVSPEPPEGQNHAQNASDMSGDTTGGISGNTSGQT